ncbi:conserved hypothetical protein [Talaromyces stipitatus ATCC 10500]|uniref:Xylanolytic transcriptional activator regulatory domain-containing protein n=1 Tax=Talaromyces stipitatus (strain ATCC 10500 / CBS 375.48 / QM 6759 / NRRL 1006) TaxID=441959 RepID=B8MM76_TALSN|nr:uncharacterized protein TSTA_098450 [Talaromyces stipitatus ATCC 10500]EED13588.1 conserved hypothetical protein [Talaromyces stipitatus ATCC 10500]
MVNAPSPSYDNRVTESAVLEESQNRELLALVKSLTAKVNSLESALRQPQVTLSERMSSEPPPLSLSANTPVISRDIGGNGDETTESTTQSTSEVEDAATILEFLAWGRCKDPKYHGLINTTHGNLTPYSPKDIDMEKQIPFFPSKIAIYSYLQSLLPSRSHLYTLVKYHCDYLLWYHGSFHTIVFQRSVDDLFDKGNGQIEPTNTGLQWTGLLFAIILGSLTCAPRTLVLSWGFNDDEREELSHRWFQAMNLCLQYSDYMSSHSIFSVQAIATVTHSAHMLGQSNSQSVLLASAVRIAQSMGLHRLGHDEEKTEPHDLINRELGRRVWCQLCTQDWFSIPFTESYLINQTSFDTTKPRNCDDRDMITKPDDIPTITNYSRYFYEVAFLMPRVQDAIVSSNTLYTRYEKVLEYDQQLRVLATTRLPHYLQNVPLDPSWPCYVPWARRCLAISTSHKVIMIHRKFLGISFVNPMFSRTRRTCVAAARTIIKELKEAKSDGGPILWIHHAPDILMNEQIILCLDMIYSLESSPECDEHRRLVQDGLHMLSVCETNMIAKRGIPLLKAMLANEKRIREKTLHEVEGSDHGDLSTRNDRRNLDISEIIRNFYQQDHLHFSAAMGRLNQNADWFDAQNQSSWPPTESKADVDRDTIMPPTGHQSIYGFEFPDNFEEVFALAANYIT